MYFYFSNLRFTNYLSTYFLNYEEPFFLILVLWGRGGGEYAYHTDVVWEDQVERWSLAFSRTPPACVCKMSFLQFQT